MTDVATPGPGTNPRAAPRRAHRLLLPDARLGVRGRGRRAGDDGAGAGAASTASRAARRCARGCTASPPTCASTCSTAGSAGPGRWTSASPSATADAPLAAAARERRGSARCPTAGSCRTAATRRAWPVARETIRLAFVAALQHLPPRQRAVLILREVLRWKADEVAELLDTTVASVNSALQRARSTLAASRHRPSRRRRRRWTTTQRALLARYVDAFERYDIDSLTVAAARGRHLVDAAATSCGSQAPTTSAAWLLGPGIGLPRLAARPDRGERVARLRPVPAGSRRRARRRGRSRSSRSSDGRITGINFFLDTEPVPAVRPAGAVGRPGRGTPVARPAARSRREVRTARPVRCGGESPGPTAAL